MREGFDYLVHDLYFAGPVRAHARHQSAVAPVWMYHFTRVPPTPWGEALGAHHAAELFYVFDTLTANDEPGERPLGLSPLGDFTAVDTGLSETMRAYWVRFAAAGGHAWRLRRRGPSASEGGWASLRSRRESCATSDAASPGADWRPTRGRTKVERDTGPKG